MRTSHKFRSLVMALLCLGGASIPAQAEGWSWTELQLPKEAGSRSVPWSNIVWGNDRFLAVAWKTTLAALSTDGQHWTETRLPIKPESEGLYFSNGLFLLAGDQGKAWSSVDGVHWRGFSFPKGLLHLTVGPNGFRALRGAGRLVESGDGEHWTELGTVPSWARYHRPTYLNGDWVMVGGGDFPEGRRRAGWSPDGLHWTPGTVPDSRFWVGVAYGNGLYLGINATNLTGVLSSDGVVWAPVELPKAPSPWTNIIFTGDFFVLIGAHNGWGALSTNGRDWVTVPFHQAQNWEGVAVGANRIVVLSGDGPAFVSGPLGEVGLYSGPVVPVWNPDRWYRLTSQMPNRKMVLAIDTDSLLPTVRSPGASLDQWWRFSQSYDGSVVLTNRFLGPSLALRALDNTDQPVGVAPRDGSGDQKWLLQGSPETGYRMSSVTLGQEQWLDTTSQSEVYWDSEPSESQWWRIEASGGPGGEEGP